MRRVWLLFSIVPLLGCSSDAIITENIIEGKWVEATTRTDTISFEIIDKSAMFTLSRGVEFQDGVSKPKYRSGTYLYNLDKDKISLKWLLSSNSEFEEYYFRINGKNLDVGNFYKATYGEILEFDRLQ
jgi:hypothetical protein